MSDDKMLKSTFNMDENMNQEKKSSNSFSIHDSEDNSSFKI